MITVLILSAFNLFAELVVLNLVNYDLILLNMGKVEKGVALPVEEKSADMATAHFGDMVTASFSDTMSADGDIEVFADMMATKKELSRMA